MSKREFPLRARIGAGGCCKPYASWLDGFGGGGQKDAGVGEGQSLLKIGSDYCDRITSRPIRGLEVPGSRTR
jgi:hypothetical protein